MLSRRDFLARTGELTALGSLPVAALVQAGSPVTAAEATVTPDIVQLTPDIEPIVRLIEQTPREKCFAMLGEQLRNGLPYRRFLAALFLAGIRNVNPQPPGFKFHCVFVAQAAHQISLDLPVAERLLPLFWVLDEFKKSQAQDVEQGDFRLRPVTGRLPSPEQAEREFHAAMEAWDEERADRAITAMVRSQSSQQVISQLWRYGARDYRNIGHKAIFVANTWRTLQTIGWQHAEPAMRSLVLGLLDFGRERELNGYRYEDQSYQGNVQRVMKSFDDLPGNWTRQADRNGQNAGTGGTTDLLAAIRIGEVEGACDLAVSLLTERKVSASAVWDAIHLAGAELMLRQPGIYGIHTVTSANGLRYAFETASTSEMRLLMLLQGVGWMAQFGHFMSTARGGLSDSRIDQLEPADLPDEETSAAQLVFETASDDRSLAARQAYAFASRFPQSEALASAGRRLVAAKGNEPHHFKYLMASVEDRQLTGSPWQPHLAAVSMLHVPGSRDPDAPTTARARDVLATLGRTGT